PRMVHAAAHAAAADRCDADHRPDVVARFDPRLVIPVGRVAVAGIVEERFVGPEVPQLVGGHAENPAADVLEDDLGPGQGGAGRPAVIDGAGHGPDLVGCPAAGGVADAAVLTRMVDCLTGTVVLA